MEFVKEKVRVDEDVYIDVEYRWTIDGDRVNIYIRYDDEHMDTLSFWPTDPMIDASRALDLVHMAAALDYDVRQCSTDS